MPIAAESPPEILIPSLPNDIALQCLARVPRQYHPVLSAVSKPIRSLLFSQEFFAARSSLNCSENLLYLGVQSQNDELIFFAVYGRNNLNPKPATESNIIIAPVPAPRLPNDKLIWHQCAAVGPKIYCFCRSFGHEFDSTEVWIFDSRFHTWEQGPSMPAVRRAATNTVVLNGKIYMIGSFIEENPLAYVFDTVAGCWEALPGPNLGDKAVRGCGVRDGKVCVWFAREELRLNPATKTWEVFEIGIGVGMHLTSQICLVNGVLCCCNEVSKTIKAFDERTGVWEKLDIVNNGFRRQWRHLRLRISTVEGRLVIMGSAFFRNTLERKGVWCLEMEVKKDRGGNFVEEILWSGMVYSTRTDGRSTFFTIVCQFLFED